MAVAGSQSGARHRGYGFLFIYLFLRYDLDLRYEL